MKRFYFGLALAALLAVSCSKKEPAQPDSIILEGEIEKIELSYAAQTSQLVKVISSGDWTLTADEDGYDWITPSLTSGKNGAAVSFTVEANKNTKARSAYYTFTCGSAKAELMVKQAKYDAAAITVTPSKGDFEAAEGTATVTVTSADDWTATSNGDWLTVNPASGTGSEQPVTVTITVAANASENARTAAITFSNGANTAKYTASQKGKQGDKLIVAPTTKEVESAATSVEVKVTSTKAWTASSDASWATLSPANGEGGETTVTVNVEKNSGSEARTAKITFTDGTLQALLTLKQKEFVPSISLDKTSLNFVEDPAAGQTVTVTADLEWTAACSADWVTINPTGSTEASKTVTITVTKNEENARQAEVVFTLKGKDIKTSLAVYQQGKSTPAPTEETTLTLESGKLDTFWGCHQGDEAPQNKVEGATVEWTIGNVGDGFDYRMVPQTGATLTVTGNNVKLVVPESTVSDNANKWTIIITKKGETAPLVLTVTQQCYNRHTNEKTGFDKNYGLVASELTDGSAMVAGTYRITNYGSGWRYCHFMASRDNFPKSCAYNGWLDNYIDFLGQPCKEDLDGNNGLVKFARADGLYDFVADGNGGFYVRPYLCEELGLGVDASGALKISPMYKNTSWTITWDNYGYQFQCGDYYMKPGSGANTENDYQEVIKANTGKTGFTSSQHIKVFKVQ